VKINIHKFFATLYIRPFLLSPTKTFILLCGRERTYIFDSKALRLLSDLKVNKKVINQIRDLTDERKISEVEMQELLKKIFPDAKKGKNTGTRIMEAAAITSYHRQTEIPVVNILL